MSQKFLFYFFCITLSGCTFIPHYQRPALPVSSQWSQGSASGDQQAGKAVPAASIGWVEFFSDPRLHKLIELALNNNRDLRVATLNVEFLAAQYRIGEAEAFPTINGSANGLKQQAISSFNDALIKSSNYSLTLGVTAYEVDLWGRVRSLKKQALENYFSTQEAQKSVQISLVAQVGTQYLSERSLEEQLIETQETLKSTQANDRLIKASYDLGNASLLDVKSAEVQMQTARANFFDYQRQHAQAENALALLIGQPLPSDLPPPQPFNSQKVLSDIPAGLPSDLIERRPDILEAEHQLKAANANIGAARAAFFPKILLTGSEGIASAKLTDLFSGSNVWSFAPQITMPIFDFGANGAALDAAKISKSIQVAQYEKTIQTAFREVADALTARATYNDQVEAQESLVKDQQQRYDLANIRYRNGIDNYLTVLTAQQDSYAAEQNLIQLQFARLSNLITLYKVLGGGWFSVPDTHSSS
jgi:multidrug efflux system outer membrane protein